MRVLATVFGFGSGGRTPCKGSWRCWCGNGMAACNAHCATALHCTSAASVPVCPECWCGRGKWLRWLACRPVHKAAPGLEQAVHAPPAPPAAASGGLCSNPGPPFPHSCAACLCNSLLMWCGAAPRQVARGVLDYLRRDMTAPGGGVYSAEDADSLEPAASAPASAGARSEAAQPRGGGGVGEKKEGAFYVWTEEEVRPARGGGGCVLVRAGSGACWGGGPDRGSSAEMTLTLVCACRVFAHALDPMTWPPACGAVRTPVSEARLPLLPRLGEPSPPLLTCLHPAAHPPPHPHPLHRLAGHTWCQSAHTQPPQPPQPQQNNTFTPPHTTATATTTTTPWTGPSGVGAGAGRALLQGVRRPGGGCVRVRASCQQRGC